MKPKGDIIDAIVQDARRLRVADKLSESIQWPDVHRVQRNLARLMEVEAIPQAQIARMLGKGFSSPVISGFLRAKSAGDFTGDLSRVTRGINSFIEQYIRRKEFVKPEKFVMTRVASRGLAMIQATVQSGSIGVITGPAGTGKTMLMKAASDLFVTSVYVRVLSSTTTMAGFARLLGRSLNARAQALFKVQVELIETLAGSNRALLIDEAHKLKIEALEFIRDLHDECGIPVVLCGTVRIDQKINDAEAFFGQFTSRVSSRYDIYQDATSGRPGDPLFSSDDIVKMFGQGQLRLAADAVDELKRISNVMGHGSLRRCDRILYTAILMMKAGKIEGGVVTADVIRRIHRSMWGRDRAGIVEQVAAEQAQRRAMTA